MFTNFLTFDDVKKFRDPGDSASIFALLRVHRYINAKIPLHLRKLWCVRDCANCVALRKSVVLLVPSIITKKSAGDRALFIVNLIQ